VTNSYFELRVREWLQMLMITIALKSGSASTDEAVTSEEQETISSIQIGVETI